MVCKECKKYSQPVNPCLGVLGFDGHYTWGTPIHEEDRDQYPQYVMDGARPPEKAEDCFAFEAASNAMVDQLLYQAQGGSEEARCHLEELGVLQPSPALTNHDRPCQCGSGQPWVSCSAASQYCG